MFVSLQTIVFYIGTSLTDFQILQDDLNILAQLETDWQMIFNVAKCHPMRVTRHLPSNQIHFNYSLHQQTLKRFVPPNTLDFLSLTTWNGVKMFLKFLVKQLRHWVFFGAIFGSCTSAYKGSCIQNIGSSSARVCSSYLVMKLGQKRWTKYRRQQPGGPADDGGTKLVSPICWTNSSGHPWRTA